MAGSWLGTWPLGSLVTWLNSQDWLFPGICPQALRIPVQKAIVSEAKQEARQFALDCHSDHIMALFGDIRHIVEGKGFDYRSGRMAKIESRAIDILFMCAPCQAFSLMRNTRQCTVSQHASFGIQMSDCLDYLKSRAPFMAIQEQVSGAFTARTRGGQEIEESWLQSYISQVRALTDRNGAQLFNGAIVLSMNSKEWIGASRQRVYMVFCKDAALLRRVAERVQVVVGRQTSHHCITGPSRRGSR